MRAFYIFSGTTLSIMLLAGGAWMYLHFPQTRQASKPSSISHQIPESDVASPSNSFSTSSVLVDTSTASQLTDNKNTDSDSTYSAKPDLSKLQRMVSPFDPILSGPEIGTYQVSFYKDAARNVFLYQQIKHIGGDYEFLDRLAGADAVSFAFDSTGMGSIIAHTRDWRYTLTRSCASTSNQCKWIVSSIDPTYTGSFIPLPHSGFSFSMPDGWRLFTNHSTDTFDDISLMNQNGGTILIQCPPVEDNLQGFKNIESQNLVFRLQRTFLYNNKSFGITFAVQIHRGLKMLRIENQLSQRNLKA